MVKSVKTAADYYWSDRDTPLIEGGQELKSTSKNSKIWVYYQCLLAVGVVLIFFTKLDIFLETKGFLIPLYWLLGFIAASVPLWFFLADKVKYLFVPVVGWCGLYMAFNCLSVVVFSKIPETQLFEDRIRSLIFLLFALFVFSEHVLVQNCTKVAMLFVTLMNTFNHVYEILNPFAFGGLVSLGRPAGFYMDSNEAGCALILGMIFSIDLLKPKYRLFYASIVGFGVLLSFSRGAMLCWLITMLIFAFLRIIPRYQLIYLVMSLLGFYLILKTQFNTLVYLQNFDGSPLLNQDVLARLNWLVNPISESQDLSRVGLAEEAWQKFYDSPLFGKGLGGSASSTFVARSDGTGIKPHNMYITNMVEHGILGFILLPTLVYAVICKARGKTIKTAIPFGIFLLVWGVFSHTVFSSFFILLSFAFMSNLATQSYFKAE